MELAKEINRPAGECKKKTKNLLSSLTEKKDEERQ
jgi:hypothetical protein